MRSFLFFLFVLVSLEVCLEAETTVSPLANPSILLTRVIETESGRNDIGFDVLPLPEGALITGSTALKGSAPDGLILKVNSRGEVLWRRVLGGAGLDLIFSALPDGADGFVCVGFKSPRGEAGMKAMDGWILKINASGEVLWEHTYGGPGEDRLTGIRKTPTGWMAAGHKQIGEKIQAWVLRIDAEGKEVHSWNYETSLPTKGLDAIPLQDGGFVLAGGQGEERETSDGFVVRVDANGRPAWSHLIDGPGFQVGYHLQPFSDGSFLVIGYGATEKTKEHQAYVLRITAEGKVLYHNNLGGPTHDRATNARILDNNSLIVVGQTQRPGAPNEDSGWDMILYALDANATPVWSARYGGEGVEFGRAVKGNANNLWIIGHTTSEQSGSNVLLIRMDASTLLHSQ